MARYVGKQSFFGSLPQHVFKSGFEVGAPYGRKKIPPSDFISHVTENFRSVLTTKASLAAFPRHAAIARGSLISVVGRMRHLGMKERSRFERM